MGWVGKHLKQFLSKTTDTLSCLEPLMLENKIMFSWFLLEDRNLSRNSGITMFPLIIPVSVPAILDRNFLFLQEHPRNFCGISSKYQNNFYLKRLRYTSKIILRPPTTPFHNHWHIFIIKHLKMIKMTQLFC